MQPTIIHKTNAHYTTVSWAGGTSTQMFIYPVDARLDKRDFGFRLSRASVEVLESTFTILPNVYRTLVLLEGAFTLNHKNNYSKLLVPYMQDSFWGHWETECVGKGVDLNLMCNEPYSGEVFESTDPNLIIDAPFVMFFALHNNCTIAEYTLNKYELLIVDATQLMLPLHNSYYGVGSFLVIKIFIKTQNL